MLGHGKTWFQPAMFFILFFSLDYCEIANSDFNHHELCLSFAAWFGNTAVVASAKQGEEANRSQGMGCAVKKIKLLPRSGYNCTLSRRGESAVNRAPMPSRRITTSARYLSLSSSTQTSKADPPPLQPCVIDIVNPSRYFTQEIRHCLDHRYIS